MSRFHDSRFPNLEIRNHGGSLFEVWVRGENFDPYYQAAEGWTQIDIFTNRKDKRLAAKKRFELYLKEGIGNVIGVPF